MECQIYGADLEITTMKIAEIHGSILNALILRRMKSRVKKKKKKKKRREKE